MNARLCWIIMPITERWKRTSARGERRLRWNAPLHKYREPAVAAVSVQIALSGGSWPVKRPRIIQTKHSSQHHPFIPGGPIEGESHLRNATGDWFSTQFFVKNSSANNERLRAITYTNEYERIIRFLLKKILVSTAAELRIFLNLRLFQTLRGSRCF